MDSVGNPGIWGSCVISTEVTPEANTVWVIVVVRVAVDTWVLVEVVVIWV
jgi:hypothetical protein